ncbi:MAG TPA: S-methyl-5-thioribose-1-phosphate isomerase [Phycisphaerae bacterium]
MRTIEWVGDLDGHVALIDQTLLPERLEILRCADVECIWEAIRNLRVRGAPAIGIAAAMGVVLAVRAAPEDDPQRLIMRIDEACDYLATARPTAVNLFWALERMKRCARGAAAELATPSPPWGEGGARGSVNQIKLALLNEAKAIRDEDAAMCRAIGRAGLHLIREGIGVLTHCNAGGLATAEYGTALAPLYAAHEAGRHFRVFATETRPLLQGSRLTAWELQRADIDVTVICDSMAAQVMRASKVNLVIVGADRIAANGDVANKIGTYGLAVLAKAHAIPFYVAAPSSTFDLSIADGSQIPIEQRSAEEIRRGFGRLTAPEDVACYSPAFDVTPAELVTGIFTDRGLIAPVTRAAIADAIRP